MGRGLVMRPLRMRMLPSGALEVSRRVRVRACPPLPSGMMPVAALSSRSHTHAAATAPLPWRWPTYPPTRQPTNKCALLRIN